MLEKLIRRATALLIGILALGASAGASRGAETGSGAAPPEIELRKSFRSLRRVGQQLSGGGRENRAGVDPGTPAGQPGVDPPRLGGVADALGEQLQSSGTLHLPDVGGGGIVLQAANTPILETVTGRHLILDRDRTIAADVVEGISRRWPGFLVVQPPAGAGLQTIIDTLLDAAGYDAVLRDAPLTFGRGITLRITPDFIVLRSDRDLLAGETRAISVVEPAEVLPPELRELAGQHRVRIVELTAAGEPAGSEQAPWRDSAGRVTTVEATRAAPVIEEIALALGCTVERRVPFPATAEAPARTADLGIGRDAKTHYVFARADPGNRESAGDSREAAITVKSAAALPEAIGTLIERLGLTAIGPAVEFYRAAKPGARRRFVIGVPGWLVESGGRRLLITDVAPPPLVRLYLTREGIDLFEYRIRDGR